MRKIFTLMLLATTASFFGQNPIVTGEPSSYTVIDENIQIIFDVTAAKDRDGNSLKGKDLYIWAWSSAGDAKTNRGWTNISNGAKLTKMSDTEYRLIFPIIDGDATYKTLAELFGAEAAPGSIKAINFLLRDKSPTFQTGDLVIPFSAFKFEDQEVRVFPSQATTKDVVTFRFNKSYSGLSNPAMTGAAKISVHIEPANDSAASIELETQFNGKYYQQAIIPAASFKTLFSSNTLRELKYYFFDTDNPTIKSAESSIILKQARN